MIHARKAFLQGLNPKQNRTIPPLNYDVVKKLKKSNPELLIEINGGFKNIDDSLKVLNHFDGVMIGRAVLENPYSIIDVDNLFYDDNSLVPSRIKIAEDMIYYLEDCAQKGIPINIITQNMLGLFHGCRGAKVWRSYLSHQAPRRRDDPKVLSEAINLVLEAQNEAA